MLPRTLFEHSGGVELNTKPNQPIPHEQNISSRSGILALSHKDHDLGSQGHSVQDPPVLCFRLQDLTCPLNVGALIIRIGFWGFFITILVYDGGVWVCRSFEGLRALGFRA